MSSFIKEFVSRNLRNPQKGLGAFWAERFFIKRNTSLMINTVSLADIHPDHVVLELGYGPGVGLEEAWKRIKDGNGKLYGIDISEPMFNAATKRLSKQIATGRVNIAIGDVMNLPYEDNSIDRVFHANCFYFWPDQLKGAQELYRVMSPGGFMMTGMNTLTVNKLNEMGYMKYGSPNVDAYMNFLIDAGFSDVRKEEVKSKNSGNIFTAIHSSVKK